VEEAIAIYCPRPRDCPHRRPLASPPADSKSPRRWPSILPTPGSSRPKPIECSSSPGSLSVSKRCRPEEEQVKSDEEAMGDTLPALGHPLLPHAGFDRPSFGLERPPSVSRQAGVGVSIRDCPATSRRKWLGGGVVKLR
jgi:hypothetical protein